MFFTKAETAALLRIHGDTVRAMLLRGDLEGFQSGRITRIRVDSVERLIGGPLEKEVQADSTEGNGVIPEDDGANGLTAIEPEDNEGALQDDRREALAASPEMERFEMPAWPEGTTD